MVEIIVQEIESGEFTRFPMAPDKINVQAATRFLSYDIMKSGEHKIPLGEELTKFSWSGILPGMPRMGAPYINLLAWLPPVYFQSKFSIWRNKGTKLQLMITSTPIIHKVYLESYTCEYYGGAGDIKYSVEFCVAKDIIVEKEGEESGDAAAGDGVAVLTTAATAAAQPKTYTVKSGDSLWKIAQNVLGDGSRWREIYDLNKSVVGSNPNLIYPGQVYNLPG